MIEDKGKMKNHDQSDMLGKKPYGNIGPDRNEVKSVVSKLKKKKVDTLRAEGSTFESGEKANIKVTKAIGNLVNK
jgi:hypothetical protein